MILNGPSVRSQNVCRQQLCNLFGTSGMREIVLGSLTFHRSYYWYLFVLFCSNGLASTLPHNCSISGAVYITSDSTDSSTMSANAASQF